MEAYHGFQQWLTFGREGTLTDRNPEEVEKLSTYADVLTNAVILHTFYELTKALKSLIDEGYPVRWADYNGSVKLALTHIA